MNKETAKQIFSFLLEEPREYGTEYWCEDYGIESEDFYTFIAMIRDLINSLED